MPLQQWMINELRLAHKVLIISNEAYVERADDSRGGVGWETRLIQQDMARLDPLNTKYLAVVRCEDCERGLPYYLQGKFAFHWPNPRLDDSNQRELLMELFEVDSAPSIGEARVFL